MQHVTVARGHVITVDTVDELDPGMCYTAQHKETRGWAVYAVGLSSDDVRGILTRSTAPRSLRFLGHRALGQSIRA